jgi:hypothetical protein
VGSEASTSSFSSAQAALLNKTMASDSPAICK